MLVTLSGIETVSSAPHPSNAWSAILVTPSGIVTHLTLPVGSPDGICAADKFFTPSQSLKAKVPMLVTFAGIIKLVSPQHPSNAEGPMLVTLSGIVTLVSPLQEEKAFQPMLVTG